MMIRPRKKYFLSIIVIGLPLVFLLPSCQPSTLHVGGAHEPTTTASQTPHAKQRLEVPTRQAPEAGLIMTSSSDASPDTRHTDLITLDHEDFAQATTSLSQGSILASFSADTTLANSGKDVVKKTTGIYTSKWARNTTSPLLRRLKKRRHMLHIKHGLHRLLTPPRN